MITYDYTFILDILCLLAYKNLRCFFWKWHVKHSQFLYFWIITDKPTSPANLPTLFFSENRFCKKRDCERDAGRPVTPQSCKFVCSFLRYFFEVLLWDTSLRYFFEILLWGTSFRYFFEVLWSTSLRYFFEILWGTSMYFEEHHNTASLSVATLSKRWDLSSPNSAWTSFAKYVSKIKKTDWC